VAAGSPIYPHSTVLAAVPTILCPPLAWSSNGPSTGAPDGRAPGLVGAPIHLHNPVLAAVPPIRCPLLTGSFSVAPTHSNSQVLAAVPPILRPLLAGSSTGPSPGAPDGRAPEAMGVPSNSTVQSWLQFIQPCAHTWLVPPPWPLLAPRLHQLPPFSADATLP